MPDKVLSLFVLPHERMGPLAVRSFPPTNRQLSGMVELKPQPGRYVPARAPQKMSKRQDVSQSWSLHRCWPRMSGQALHVLVNILRMWIRIVPAHVAQPAG